MFRIRFNKNSFQDAHYVSTVTRWSDETLKEVNISQFSFWKCRKKGTALELMEKVKDYAVEKGFNPELYELEEYEEEK